MKGWEGRINGCRRWQREQLKIDDFGFWGVYGSEGFWGFGRVPTRRNSSTSLKSSAENCPASARLCRNSFSSFSSNTACSILEIFFRASLYFSIKEIVSGCFNLQA